MWLRVDPRAGHQKDMYLKEIGIHAQNTFTILSSTVSIIWGTYVTI